MLTVTYNSRMPDDAEMAKTEVWMEASPAGFAVALVAVMVNGARLLAGTAVGCGDQPAAMEAAERMIRGSRLGQAFVSYHWGRPELATVPVSVGADGNRRRVA